MELWIPITIFAAFSQNIRSALQKHLTRQLSTVGATQARFLYAVPFVAIYLVGLRYLLDYPLPTPGYDFFVFASIGGIAQILATAALLSLFSQRNFFVGTAYSKTETVQAAILGIVVLADSVTTGAVIGICLGVVGVMTISAAHDRSSVKVVIGSLTTRSALTGIASGLLFGITAICIRGASLTLSGGFVIQAAFTLSYVITLQAAAVTIYLLIKEPRQMTAVFKNWRIASWVGLTGMLASVGWFTAMTLQNAGYVRALGQIELIFSLLASALIFKEKTTRIELAGAAIIIVSIIILLLYR